MTATKNKGEKNMKDENEYRCDCGSTEKPIATLINGFECGWATCKECMISGNTQDFILRRK